MAFDAEQIRHTLLVILQTQGDEVAVEVLENARIDISHVQRDFGNDFYSLDLRIPPERFAILEDKIEEIADRIQKKLWKLGFDTEEGSVNGVRIYPQPSVGAGAIAVQTPTRRDENRIWAARRVRLFLSHVSSVKIAASKLKEVLAPFGVDAFVAHEDIQPTVQWHQEIEFALRSMDVLCAIVTEDFIKSKWTDQEVGFALGRGIPVIAVSCPTNPYGLLGKHQAIKADLTKMDPVAVKIMDIIADYDLLRPRLIDGLVESFVNAISFQHAKDTMKRVMAISKHLSDQHIVRLLEAIRDNDQVHDAHGVPSQIRSIAGSRKITLPERSAGSSDFDDDIPF